MKNLEEAVVRLTTDLENLTKEHEQSVEDYKKRCSGHLKHIEALEELLKKNNIDFSSISLAYVITPVTPPSQDLETKTEATLSESTTTIPMDTDTITSVKEEEEDITKISQNTTSTKDDESVEVSKN